MTGKISPGQVANSICFDGVCNSHDMKNLTSYPRPIKARDCLLVWWHGQYGDNNFDLDERSEQEEGVVVSWGFASQEFVEWGFEILFNLFG